MENSAYYREAIQEELQYLPEEHLRHLYGLILLMAQAFKCPPTSPAPEKLSPAHLQAYADKFREGFSLIMKKSVGLNFSFQIQEKFTILKVSFPDIEMQKDTIEEAVFDLEQICEEKQLRIVFEEVQQKYVLRYQSEPSDVIEDNYSEKMIIPEAKSNGLYFIEVSEVAKWQADNAQEDGKNLFALMLKTLDQNKKEKVISI